MTGKEFINSLANGKSDIIQLLLDILSRTDSQYCLIGGLAVNAYTEPVVSLDLDIVAASENIEDIRKAAKENNFKVEEFEHSVNIKSDDSDLRIQFQTDPRYQIFISTVEDREILGYKMKVARVEDVLQGNSLGIYGYGTAKEQTTKRFSRYIPNHRTISSS